MSLFDLTANTNSRKLMTLDPDFPKDVSVIVNKGNTASATFNVSITEIGRPKNHSYQWYVNGNPVEGATNDTFTKEGLSETEVLSIVCEVTNKAGTVRSREANLKVTKFEVDSNYPQDAKPTIYKIFTCKIVIPDDLKFVSCTYQWFKNGTAVEGATNSEYTFTPNNVGLIEIYCEVTNSLGKITSRTARIDVLPEYLFNYGKQNYNWTASNLRYSTAGNSNHVMPGIATNEDGSVTIAINDGGEPYNQEPFGSGIYRVSEAIDFSKYKKITIDTEITGYSAAWFLSIYPVSSDAWGGDRDYGGDAVSITSLSFGKNTKALDVSGINATYYIGVGAQSDHYPMSYCKLNVVDMR